MVVRYYSSVAPPTTLSAGITSGSTSIQVGSTTGFPALTPYTLSIDYGSSSEELVQVNSVGGVVLSVTRAIDGTSATSHNAGAIIRHVSSARDFADSRSHENADQEVHGLGPGEEIVGTEKVQTLSNKILDMASGTLRQIDILNGPSWVTTISGDATTPGLIFQLKPDPSQNAVFDFGSTGISRWRNVAAHDISNQYKFRITKSDGTTDVLYITSFGQIRSTLGNGVDGVVIQGSPDNVRRRSFYTLDSDGTTTRSALYTDGTAFLSSKAPGLITLDITEAPAQTAGAIRVRDSASNTVFNVAADGSMTNSAVSTGDLTATGNVSLPATTAVDGSVFTISAGWSLVNAFGFKRGGMTTVVAGVQRTGATLTAGADGNIVGDPQIAVITAPYRPNAFFTQAMIGSIADGGSMGSCRVSNAGGSVEILSWAPNQSITSGGSSIYRFYFTYPSV